MIKAELLALIAEAADDWSIDIIDGGPVIRNLFTIELTPAERVIEIVIHYDEIEGGDANGEQEIEMLTLFRQLTDLERTRLVEFFQAGLAAKREIEDEGP